MNKFHVKQERLKFICYSSVDWVKQKSATYIEMLEKALNETKITYIAEIERLNMIVAEFESRQFNVLEGSAFMKVAIEAERELAES